MKLIESSNSFPKELTKHILINLNFGELKSFQCTSKNFKNIVEDILKNPKNLPDFWLDAHKVFQLWKQFEQIKQSRSIKRKLFLCCYSLPFLGFGAITTAWRLLQVKLSNNFDHILNICNQTNTLINNVSTTCLSYLNSVNNSNCLVNNICKQLLCQMSDLTEIGDCKDSFDDIRGGCKELTKNGDMIFMSLISLPLIYIIVAFLTCPKFLKNCFSQFYHIPDSLRSEITTIIQSISSNPVNDVTSIRIVQTHLSQVYRSLAKFSFLQQEAILEQKSELELELNDDIYLALPG